MLGSIRNDFTAFGRHEETLAGLCQLGLRLKTLTMVVASRLI
jgi:hypothetical protein